MLLRFYIGKKEYIVIREVITGMANDVYVCRSCKEPAAPYKTVWIVKDHKTAKLLMQRVRDCCEIIFTQNETAGFVFPYFEERALPKYYISNIQGKNCTGRQIWLSLVEKCLTSGLPAPVLYLILKQDQIHAGPDGTIWFSYFLDLSEYDDLVRERDNVQVCADQIADMICLEYEADKVSAVSPQTYALLEKKRNRKEYETFMQLYSDMKLISKLKTGGNIRDAVKEKIAGVKMSVVSKQDEIFRLLSYACIVLAGMVLAVLIGYLLFGAFSLWRILGGPLDQIGTESLLFMIIGKN